MSVLEWVLVAVAIVALCVGTIIVVKLSKLGAKLPTVNSDELICYNNAKVVNKDIRCRVEGLNIPKTITEFICQFLLETGETVFVVVPEMVFNQIEEETKGNLYIKGGKYFDFEKLN